MQFLDTGAAFGLHLALLSDKIYDQMAEALADDGIVVPAKSTGIIQTLHSEGPSSQADIAARLRTSHQLIAKRITALSKQRLVELYPDPEDGRRKLIQLTAEGDAEGEKLQRFLPRLIDAYQDLFTEIEVDFHGLVARTDKALDLRPLTERLMQGKAS